MERSGEVGGKMKGGGVLTQEKTRRAMAMKTEAACEGTTPIQFGLI